MRRLPLVGLTAILGLAAILGLGGLLLDNGLRSPTLEEAQPLVPDPITEHDSSEAVSPNHAVDVDVDANWLSVIQQRIANGQHRFRDPGDSGHYTTGRASQNLQARFGPDGLTIHQLSSGGNPSNTAELKLRLQSWGSDEQQTELAPLQPELGPCAEPERLDVQGHCLRTLRYEHPGITEWWTHDTAGLRQNWTVHAPPGEGNLVLDLDAGDAMQLDDDGSVLLAGGSLNYGDLHAWDATDRPLDAHLEIADTDLDGSRPSRLRIRVDTRGATWPVVVDPLLQPTADWMTEGGAPYGLYGRSMAASGDVNGDYYDDVFVQGIGTTGAGLISGFYGNPSGLPIVPDLNIQESLGSAPMPSDFGFALATGGDVNNDGYDDVLVGAPLAGNDPQFGPGMELGEAHLFLGSPTGLNTSAAWSVQGPGDQAFLGWSVAFAGSVNGDDFDDALVGVKGGPIGAPFNIDPNAPVMPGSVNLYLGSASGLQQTPDVEFIGENPNSAFGFSIAGVGDVHDDGFDDFLVGAPFDTAAFTNGGKAYLFSGAADLGTSAVVEAATGASWSYSGPGEDYSLGDVVSAGGDINDDGYADILVGAPVAPVSSSEVGLAQVFLGGPGGPSNSADWTRVGRSGQANLGITFTGNGDVNGDGFDDLLLSENGSGSYTYVDLFLGTFDGPSAAPIWSGWGYLSDGYGLEALIAGDVDGDGLDEILISADSMDTGTNPTAGRAFLHYGASTGVLPFAHWIDEGLVADKEYGSSVAPAGDFNGDGLADVVVGAAPPTGSNGSAFLFVGVDSASLGAFDDDLGVDTTTYWEATGETAEDRFGAAIASLGDADGDSFDDIVVGAPGYDLPPQQSDDMLGISQPDHGAVYLYRGAASAPGVSPAHDEMFSGSVVNGNFGSAVASGDFNDDGERDLVVSAPEANTRTGEVFLFLGPLLDPQAPHSGLPDFTLVGAADFDALGHAITVGDFDGDDYDDLAISAPFSAYCSPTCTSPGEVRVYLGTSDLGGVHTTPWSSPDWTFYGTVDNENLGFSLAAVGDTDGNNCDDLLIGGPGHAGGRAYLVLGCTGSTPTTQPLLTSWISEGVTSQSQHGTLVAAAGDVDDDGLADFVVGAPNEENSYGESSGGRAYLFLGGQPQPSLVPAFRIEGEGVDESFPQSAAGLGDTNGDSIDDLLLGTGFDSWLASNAGRVQLHRGYRIEVDLDDDGDLQPDDCDDTNPDVGPSSTEICDGLDNDCDPVTWDVGEDIDLDGDLFAACEDCDDNNAARNPDAVEICDGLDNDCDSGTTIAGEDVDDDADNSPSCSDCDDSDPALNALDLDGDGVDTCGEDTNGDGISDGDGDCDDNDPNNFPGNLEYCDGQENDCNGDFSITGDMVDDDGDGSFQCADCDDTDDQNFPGNPEICDGQDNDCNDLDDAGEAGVDDTEVDDDGDGYLACEDCDDDDTGVGPAPITYLDADGDTYGDPAAPQSNCAPVIGEVSNADDCDDNDYTIFPGAPETSDDGVDDDCSGSDQVTCFEDGDLDTYGTTTTVDSPTGTCDLPGMASTSDDCDDTAADTYPGATEVLDDGVDQDCSGTDNVACYLDSDGDGHGDVLATPVISDDAECDEDGLAATNLDCDDTEADIHQGAEEFCDNVDSNCNGNFVDHYEDTDDDGVPNCTDEDDDGDGDPDDTDCSPLDAASYTGAAEICDGLDNDCDELTEAIDPSGKWSGESDADGDGQRPCAGDCDDDDPANFEGNPELCDGFDNDCNELADATDEESKLSGETDADEDGQRPCNGDCDDSSDQRWAGRDEICDGLDNDCNPLTEPTDSSGAWSGETDADEDGQRPCEGDCDDSSAQQRTGLDEACDGLDNDCDGDLPDDELDRDEDGHRVCGGDCNDNPDDGQAAVTHPAATETCDDISDRDCNGLSGESDPQCWSTSCLSCSADIGGSETGRGPVALLALLALAQLRRRRRRPGR